MATKADIVNDALIRLATSPTVTATLTNSCT